MYMQGRSLRFTAVSAIVVLALTGFSSGRGHGSHGGEGGGCSSSGQDHDGSSASGGGGSHGGGSSGGSSESETPDSGTSTGGSGGGAARSRPTDRSTSTAPSSGDASRPLKDGTAVLEHCASMDDPYATVEIRNPNGRDGVFTLKVSFKDSHGFTMIRTTNQVPVSANDELTYRVSVASSGRIEEIAHCEVDPRAVVSR
ncbi:hypothetical protein [Streptomyces sp. NPDC058751]|uniref:hypothetical protein n=1 Tax=Streptomyces sp. NPDC058751 TaxID=3346623 RepID=UPI0036A3F14D